MPGPGEFDNPQHEPRVVIALHPKRPVFAPHRPLCGTIRGRAASLPRREEDERQKEQASALARRRENGVREDDMTSFAFVVRAGALPLPAHFGRAGKPAPL